jgi:hypothetical protein
MKSSDSQKQRITTEGDTNPCSGSESALKWELGILSCQLSVGNEKQKITTLLEHFQNLIEKS